MIRTMDLNAYFDHVAAGHMIAPSPAALAALHTVQLVALPFVNSTSCETAQPGVAK
jgi:arylamine N-acetyltransferase